MDNAIYLRHRNRIVPPLGDGAAPLAYLATLLKNIESLGFTCSQALIDRLRTCSREQLEQLAGEIVPALRSMVGANVAYKPMYPNFPGQVMEASDAELYLNALVHYLTLELPPYAKEPREPLMERTDLRAIELGDDDDFRAICTRLLSARVAISDTARQDVTWFFRFYGDAVVPLIPAKVPLREHVALLGSLLLTYTSQSAEVLQRYITTATDVLRFAVNLSEGDISLATPTKFRRFTRAERRLLLDLLERCGNSLTEDMLRYQEPWKRLGERLHPGEFHKRYPRTAEAFQIVRNDTPYPTFNHRVEAAIAARDVPAALNLLRQRPGELARRLDHLLRMSEQPDDVVATFGAVAERVATPVLTQVLAHFERRSNPPPLRTIFPKGNVAKVQALPNRLPALDASTCAALVAICRETLINRFRTLPPLGKVFVDEQLRNYPIPFAERSASKALRTIPRGSRLPFAEGGTVRFFLWWKEGQIEGGKPTGQVDIDLSAVLYDTNWNYMEHISFTNLRSAKYRAAHSGDIVEAPRGACEFIDIDIDSVVRYGGRYVLMNLFAFSGQPYCNLPECYAGWMMRQEPQSGEVFEPRTVQQKIDLTADTRIAIPVILDMVERQVIWADLALRNNPRWYVIVEANASNIALMGQALTSLVKPTLHELFTLHAIARGTPAPRAAADIVFAPDGDVTPYDIGIIIGEYL
jgi:hypothetical protein